MEICEILTKALKESGMTQTELASKLYVTKQAVSKWINGLDEPSKDNIIRIGEVFGNDVAEKMFKKRMGERKLMKKEQVELKDLSDINKAYQETKNVLDDCGASNYSHAVYKLLTWFITAVIGLTYHRFINDLDKDCEDTYDTIYFYLNDFIEDAGETVKKDFYSMGGDLFESWGEYKLKNHDYAREAMNLWYKFDGIYKNAVDTKLIDEFKVALVDVINENSVY